MKWRFYYTEDNTVDDAFDAPPFGLLCILHRDIELGWVILHSSNWYWYAQDQWWGGDLHGMLDQMMHLGATWPKQGRTVHNTEYNDTLLRALADKERLTNG